MPVRYLVHLPGVDDAPAERLAELLGPCLRPPVVEDRNPLRQNLTRLLSPVWIVCGTGGKESN